jgi:hypothetical protein
MLVTNDMMLNHRILFLNSNILTWFVVSLYFLVICFDINMLFFLTFSHVIQLVFAVFNGEAWGYLGSRKFLQELHEGADSVSGISSLMIDQVSGSCIRCGNGSMKLFIITYKHMNALLRQFCTLVFCHDLGLRICVLQVVMNIYL